MNFLSVCGVGASLSRSPNSVSDVHWDYGWHTKKMKIVDYEKAIELPQFSYKLLYVTRQCRNYLRPSCVLWARI